jgi:AraC family transcriptional regulator of adaptative response / DNA-3-methyladenine glycosylase II
VVMGKIARQFGEMSDGRLYFPAPESLAGLDPRELPMPAPRARAIRELARAVQDARVDFATPDPAELVAQLTSLPGVGPWTAQYVAMRAANDPDAFLHSDRVLRRVAREHFGIATEQGLLTQSESWRPWRAYAGMYLWRMAQ